jgi:hypothetical protein
VWHQWLFGVVHGSKGRQRAFLPNGSLMIMQIFVRAFDMDERLVGVAFLDVGVYVTSLRSLKNVLLIGDAVKSVWFVAFQVRLGAVSFY